MQRGSSHRDVYRRDGGKGMLRGGQTRFNLPARLLGLCIAVSGVLLAVPSLASAANTLSLGLDPSLPAKGKPFQVVATGEAEPDERPGAAGGYDVVLRVYIGPGTSQCASTNALERANPDNLRWSSVSGSPSFVSDDDLPTGAFE